MSELSDTDNRVLNYLRERRRKTSAIASECFATRNSRPAAAHLARMKHRGLVRAVAGYWEITERAAHPSPELPLS